MWGRWVLLFVVEGSCVCGRGVMNDYALLSSIINASAVERVPCSF